MKVEKTEGTSRVGIGAWITGRYTRQGLWSLFLMCAFPLHAWTLILAFRDQSWLTDRTNAWDAVGVASYGLVFTFVESLALWAAMVLLGYLVAGHWDPKRRVAILTVLAFFLSVWAMLEQLFFLVEMQLPGWWIDLLVRSSHPLWILYGVLLVLVGTTVLAPVWLVVRSERVYAWVLAAIDSLSVLAIFYLLLDVIGLVIVILRNV